MTFVRARWLGTAALGVLAAAGGTDSWPLWGPVALLGAGNGAAWLAGRRTTTLTSQRRLGVSAVLLDATVVWLVALLAADALAPSVYALFILVVAEAAVRYAPIKGLAAALALVGTLAGAMALRDATGGESFDASLFAFWAALILLVGTLVGTAVREVYRQRALDRPRPTHLDPTLAELLTPREREVLRMITEGQSNTRIAETLVIERKTVKNHINSIYSKLHLNSRYEAITQTLGQRRDASGAVTQEDPHAEDRVHPLP